MSEYNEIKIIYYFDNEVVPRRLNFKMARDIISLKELKFALNLNDKFKFYFEIVEQDFGYIF
jgi:hypothetical protein